MKEIISQSQFIDAFRQSEERKSHFSYDGLIALYDYFEELESGMGQDIEFDMIAICCEYTEYTLKEFAETYDIKDMIASGSDLLTSAKIGLLPKHYDIFISWLVDYDEPEPTEPTVLEMMDILQEDFVHFYQRFIDFKEQFFDSINERVVCWINDNEFIIQDF